MLRISDGLTRLFHVLAATFTIFLAVNESNRTDGYDVGGLMVMMLADIAFSCDDSQ